VVPEHGRQLREELPEGAEEALDRLLLELEGPFARCSP
jgi:hypothetical protein